MVAQAPPARPAAVAAGRLSRATLAIGALGLLTALFTIERLVETWHVTPRAASHTVTVLGQRLTYPAANVSAVAVLLLASLGLMITLRALAAGLREIRRSRAAVRSFTSVATFRTEDGVYVLADPHPDAFTAGLLRPRVFITTGALALFDDDDARAAVLAHERHHATRRDPLRRAAWRVLNDALFFVPAVRRLTDRELALSELGADESAIVAGRSALARALLALEPHGGVDPARVDYLLDETGRHWMFPTGLCALAAATLALLGLTTALLAHAAAGTATLAPPFLSQQPCILTLAAIPVAVGAAGILARCSRASVRQSGASSRVRGRRLLHSR